MSKTSHRRLRIAAAAGVAAATVALGTGISAADDISNSLDATIDATAEVMPLNVGGPTATTTLFVTPRNGDGKNGCNLTGSTALDVDVASSDLTVATVSPSTLTFGSCGDVKTITVTPVGAGTATVSVAQTSNTTGGTFNLAPATFTVTVSPPANTAPSISVAGVTGGASYHKGAVPAATCNVTDAEDGDSSFPATLGAVSGPYAADGIGLQTASCAYTDGGGLTAAASETYSIVDPSPPGIGFTVSPPAPDGDNGWYTGDVSVTWSVNEAESPSSLVKSGCVDQSIVVDQPATDYSCAASSAGGSAGPVTVTIKRDGTPPAVSYDSATGTVGAHGWYTSDVTATFVGIDDLSGPASVSKQETSSGEGSAVIVSSPAFTDNAGNTTPAGAASHSFMIDKTAPSVALVGGPADGGSYYFGSVPSTPTCSAADATSGLDGPCQVTGYSTSVGTHTVSASARDYAGLVGTTAGTTYTVLPWTANGFYKPVDMAGTLNTVKGGSTVPLKFELFAGPTEITDTAAIDTFKAVKVNCTTGAGLEDPIEVTTTGGTSLRYDVTGGQFVQNWKTPAGAGTCYAATMTATDGTSITALFKLK